MILNASNKDHQAIVTGAILAADSFGVSRIRTAREQLQLHDIKVNDVILEEMVFKVELKMLVIKKMTLRDWKALPSSFESDAVNFLFHNELKCLFNKKDISMRIKASKALTFEELMQALI